MRRAMAFLTVFAVGTLSVLLISGPRNGLLHAHVDIVTHSSGIDVPSSPPPSAGPHPDIDLKPIADVDCVAHPEYCRGPVSDKAAALALVSGEMQRMTGGTLPTYIDVTLQVASSADQILSPLAPDGATHLSADHKVWVVRTYGPVDIASRIGSPTPDVMQHGAAWVIDARTGIVVTFGAFR